MNYIHELSLPILGTKGSHEFCKNLGATSDLELKTLSPKIERPRGRPKSINISEINKIKLDTTKLKIKNRQIILKLKNQK